MRDLRDHLTAFDRPDDGPWFNPNPVKEQKTANAEAEERRKLEALAEGQKALIEHLYGRIHELQDYCRSKQAAPAPSPKKLTDDQIAALIGNMISEPLGSKQTVYQDPAGLHASDANESLAEAVRRGSVKVTDLPPVSADIPPPTGTAQASRDSLANVWEDPRLWKNP
jgi:hypothetical protein